MCSAAGEIKAAEIVDHITPHRGDAKLFFCYANTQSLCADHHDRVKQAIEVGTFTAIGVDGFPVETVVPRQSFARLSTELRPTWLKPSRVPLTIVCGAPASGKSTLVSKRSKPDDLIIDLDVIASEMAGTSLHAWPRRWLEPAMQARNAALWSLSNSDAPWHHAWLIVTEPEPHYRKWWARKLCPVRIVVVMTPPETCFARIKRDAGRAERAAIMRSGVSTWHRKYKPRDGDVIVHGY